MEALYYALIRKRARLAKNPQWAAEALPVRCKQAPPQLDDAMGWPIKEKDEL